MDLSRDGLLNQKAQIEQAISSKEAEIKTLELHNSVAKTKSEKLSNIKSIDELNDEILLLKQQLVNIEKELYKLKRFDRERCLSNIDYLLAQSDKKLGALERESGNNPGYLSRMKSGKSPSDPSIEFLMTASDELNVPLEMLVSSRLSEMSATEVYILDFLKKVYEDTKQDNIVWERESIAELENIEVQFDSNGHPYVDHPLYTYEEGNLPDGTYSAVAKYNSLFFKDCGVKPCSNCYHAKLLPTEQEIYIMDCKKGDDRLIWKSDRFFELYIVTWNLWNGTARKLCNVLEVSSPIVSMINTLGKAIIMSMTHVHIDEEVKGAIDSYMKGIKPSVPENLPFK